jgi:hypothetical protein
MGGSLVSCHTEFAMFVRNKKAVLFCVGLLLMVIGAVAYLGFIEPSSSEVARYGYRAASTALGGTGAILFLIGIGLLVWGMRTKQSVAVGPNLGVGSEPDELVSLRARIKDLESELAAAKPDAESRADVVSAPALEAPPIQAVAIQPPDDEEAERKTREERLRALLAEMSH